MKKLLSLLCIVGMLFGMGVPVYAETGGPTLMIDNLVANAGEEIEVPIRISNNTGILGATITITYAKELTLTKVQKGDALTSLTMTKPGKLSANPINIVWDGESDADVSNGAIAILTFTAPKVNGRYSITISYKSGAVIDADLKPVSLDIENGTVEVQNGVHIHTLIAHTAKNATCTENGNSAYWSCSGCDKLFSDADAANEIKEIPEIKATGHKTELQNAKNATCTAEGYTGDEVCTICGQTIKKGETIEKVAHSYNDGVVTTEPTCVKEGVKTYTCKVCGGSYTESIAKVAHKTELKNAKEATCTAEGYTGDEICTVCGQTIKEGQTVEKLKHTYDDGVVTTEPTCVKEGVKTYTCTVCGDSYTESIAKVAHKTELKNVKAATCTAEGYTGDEVCTICGQTIKKGETIEKVAHSYNDGVVTTEPTCVKEGVKTYSCTVCGDSYTESVAKVEHKTELQNAKAATCTAEGYTGDEVCTVCKEIIKQGETITKLEHTYDEGKITTEPSCKAEGEKTYTCTECGDTYTEKVAKTEHKTELENAKEATCTENGYTGDEVCKTCGETITKGKTIPKLGHKTELKGAKDATCTEDGYTGDEVCKTCGETMETGKAIPAKGHTWDNGKVTQKPTLTKEGVKTYTCTVCADTKTERIEKLTTCDAGEDCPTHNYKDVKFSQWYHLDVDYVVESGLMVGDGGGIFRPDNKLSRAEMVQILYNWAGKPEVTGSSKFSDVADGAWYAKPVIWATENGIVNGVGNGKFAPNDPVTREQLVAMLYRYAEKPEVSNALTDFADANKISDYAVDAVKWAVEQDILRGDGSPRKLRPTDHAKRREVAAMLHRYIG